MEDTPTYGVVLIATPPAAGLSHEAFCQAAITRTQVVGAQLAALPSVSHYPATKHCPAFVDYLVQVYDVAQATDQHPCGYMLKQVTAKSPEQCLAKLGNYLRDLEEAAYEADPSVFIDAQIEQFQQQEAYA